MLELMHRKKNRDVDFLSLLSTDVRKVLDVGCGDGSLGANLKKKGIETVVGIERDERLCAFAKENIDEAFAVDAEQFKLPYMQDYFDCIIYKDVLEHLIDPLTVLKEHKQYLNGNGYVIASIPNIRYYKVIIKLIFDGTWDYVDAGILDRAHLRFFTLLNIKELFIEAGYEVVKIKRNIIASRGLKLLNFLCFDKLKEYLTYQYYIKAKKSRAQKLSRARKIYKF